MMRRGLEILVQESAGCGKWFGEKGTISSTVSFSSLYFLVLAVLEGTKFYIHTLGFHTVSMNKIFLQDLFNPGSLVDTCPTCCMVGLNPETARLPLPIYASFMRKDKCF